MATERVLFLCTGNSARSQMAEGFLRYYAGERFDVYSAGLEPKGVHPSTIQAMGELGIDVSGHTSNRIEEYMDKLKFDYVITVCGAADQHCPHALWSQGVKLHWPFDDPAAAEGTEDEKLAKFRAIREQIAEKVQAWVAAL